ncbi:MAG TPA: CaiB/BaiF CoA-transferase family protein [Acidimicrobiales bacterium]
MTRVDPAAIGPGARPGLPLDGIRVLAMEQMQALPFGTQLLGRLGADVVKVEAPGSGDSGRGARPAMTDADGRSAGCTFLRNNLNKRSIVINLKSPQGRQLILDLAPRFDVVAENFKAGTLERLGLGYDAVAGVAPRCVYVSVSGFGNQGTSPYRSWPAYAAIAEAMSGIYEFKRTGDMPPTPAPVGALGDIGSSLFAVIGLLAALRQRDLTGEGQYVDVAMFDAMVAMTDLVTNFWSMGLRNGDLGPSIMHGFRASDGWFILQVGREHQFAQLADVVGHPEWRDDERLATRQGWLDHLEDVIRPGVEGWAADKTKLVAAGDLGRAGVAAGPCLSDEEVVSDPHVAARHMLTELERTDGVAQPVLIPGNPIKMSTVTEVPDHAPPRLGEHTENVLRVELGLDDRRLAELRAAGIVN